MRIDSAASAMRVSLTRHAISAHDVANLNTPGFSEKQPHQTDLRQGGVRIAHVSSRPNQPGQPSNTSLVEESVEQKVNLTTLKAQTSVTRVQDHMNGELLDLLA